MKTKDKTKKNMKPEYIQMRNGVETVFYKNEGLYSGWDMYDKSGNFLGTTFSIVTTMQITW